jgi:Adenosylmethionine-8-amino-7-oxononanoate aminotransferase
VAGYLQAVRAICDKYDILLILDEIMCGVGRTGTMHAWEQEGVVPDIQAVAKGLGGGYVPIGAVLLNHKVFDTMAAGSGYVRRTPFTALG